MIFRTLTYMLSYKNVTQKRLEINLISEPKKYGKITSVTIKLLTCETPLESSGVKS